jgi:hypothetical protein
MDGFTGALMAVGKLCPEDRSKEYGQNFTVNWYGRFGGHE